MSSTTIELNGKRYDARTGTILSEISSVSASHKNSAKTAMKKQPAKVIDGFTKRTPATVRPNTTAHAVHKKHERSKTLMRTAVKKPVLKTETKAAPKLNHGKQSHHLDINPNRAHRASSIKKSNLVRRFGEQQRAITPVTTALPVQPEPAAPPVTLDHHLKPSITDKKLAHQKSLQRAIENSNSHSQPKAKKSTRRQRLSRKLKVSNRAMNLASASLAAVLIIGFIAYQNVPNLSMRLAVARAGVEGSLPGYQPAGFGLAGPISYQQGQITLNYSSHSDDRKFTVNQKASQWNSETLLESFVAVGEKTYQAFQDSGKTIYIYDDNNATWVDGGVWYQIEGNSALSSDQLLRMAASM